MKFNTKVNEYPESMVSLNETRTQDYFHWHALLVTIQESRRPKVL